MRPRISAVVLAFCTCATLSSAALMDSFDTYQDQAAFQAVWKPWSSNGSSMTLKSSGGRNGSQSVSGVATATGTVRNARNLDSFSDYKPDAGNQVVFEFWLYDDDPSMPSTTGTARNFNEIRAYTGNGIPAYGGAGLQGLIAMGLYNTPVNDDYFHGRVYYGGVNSWISLNTKRTAGWHKLTSIVSDLSVSFLVDGVLDTSIPLTDANKLYAFDGVIMGSGLTSGGYDVAFDDLSVSKAPEPVTVVLFGLGALLLRSRRTLSC